MLGHINVIAIAPVKAVSMSEARAATPVAASFPPRGRSPRDLGRWKQRPSFHSVESPCSVFRSKHHKKGNSVLRQHLPDQSTAHLDFEVQSDCTGEALRRQELMQIANELGHAIST